MEINIKKRLINILLIAPFLFGCKEVGNSSASIPKEDVIWQENENELLATVDEEKLFEESDLVYIITARDKGDAVILYHNFYTFYFLEIDEILKGEDVIDSILLYGDTTNEKNITSIDEILIKGSKYKIYLKKKGEYYFTTAGFKCIIEIK